VDFFATSSYSLVCDERNRAVITKRSTEENPMPLVRIAFEAGKPDSYRAAISDQVYQAMRETLAIPEGDRFQVITEHDRTQLIADARFTAALRYQPAASWWSMGTRPP
jgi:hypothetical protein